MKQDIIPTKSCLNCQHVKIEVIIGKRYVDCFKDIPQIIDRIKHYDHLDSFDTEEEMIHLAALDCQYFEEK